MQNELLIFIPEEARSALRPIASLISKSDKALQKCAQGTWQHSILDGNVRALRTALALMQKELGETLECDQADVEEARAPVAAMIDKTAMALERSIANTSQHTLLRNRMKALRIAAAVIEESGH